MKIKDIFLTVCLWAADYKTLAKWYEEVLGFKVRETLNYPNDEGVDFDFGENYFFIGRHDKVSGANKDKYRIMIGFNVESVSEVYKELLLKDVKVIATPFEAPPGGFWCMTIEDPEENIIQFYGQK